MRPNSYIVWLISVLLTSNRPFVHPNTHGFISAGLGMTLTLQKGDYVNLYEGEGYSFKYTQEQLEHIATSSGLVMKQIWKDSNNHVALCCLTRNSDK